MTNLLHLFDRAADWIVNWLVGVLNVPSGMVALAMITVIALAVTSFFIFALMLYYRPRRFFDRTLLLREFTLFILWITMITGFYLHWLNPFEARVIYIAVIISNFLVIIALIRERWFLED